MEAITRPCRKCGKALAPNESQVRRGNYICAKCNAKAQVDYRARRHAEGRPIIGVRPASTPEKRAVERAYAHARYHNDPTYRAKQIARAAARHAAQSGKLAKAPCEVCGASKVEAHHDDYSQPLNVRWLCRTHHREHHAAERKAA